MLSDFTQNYLLDKKVKICQPVDGYRASSDAVLLSAMVASVCENARILDVGAGTGAISLCLAHRLQEKKVKIDGVEIQSELVNLANYSAKLNNFNNLHFYETDIFVKEKMKLQPCSYDAVISNPPYSEHDMPSPKISKATAHNYKNNGFVKWLEFCLKMTKPFGHIYIINRVEALPQICQMFSGGLTLLPIYSKKRQSAKRIIVSVQKDSKSACRILPPFLVHDEEGHYTDSAQQILRQGLSFAQLDMQI